MNINPLSPDAPLIHLLSVKDNPMLTEMSEDQLVALVQKIRHHATSAPTLAAADAEAGKRVAPKNAKKRELLDSI